MNKYAILKECYDNAYLGFSLTLVFFLTISNFVAVFPSSTAIIDMIFTLNAKHQSYKKQFSAESSPKCAQTDV